MKFTSPVLCHYHQDMFYNIPIKLLMFLAYLV